MSVNVAVLVSGGGTNLQALIDAQRRGEIPNGKITAVISSNPDAYALERAQQAGITGITIARKNFGSAREMTVALVETLRELDIGLVVMAGFMVIITNELVEAYPNAILNIHPSLIPSFCGKGCYGLHVHEKALEYGNATSAVKNTIPGDLPSCGLEEIDRIIKNHKNTGIQLEMDR